MSARAGHITHFPSFGLSDYESQSSVSMLSRPRSSLMRVLTVKRTH